jgi:hypothetical protein
MLYGAENLAMRPDAAESRFLGMIASTGAALDALTPAEGVELMLGFYHDERAEGCPVESDGDMLLCQWGTYDWGKGESFEFNITRQFMTPVGEDDDIEQLSLTFGYPPMSPPDDLGKGERWCHTPGDLPAFREFIEGSLPYRTLGRSRAGSVSLAFDGV